MLLIEFFELLFQGLEGFLRLFQFQIQILGVILFLLFSDIFTLAQLGLPLETFYRCSLLTYDLVQSWEQTTQSWYCQ